MEDTHVSIYLYLSNGAYVKYKQELPFPPETLAALESTLTPFTPEHSGDTPPDYKGNGMLVSLKRGDATSWHFHNQPAGSSDSSW